MVILLLVRVRMVAESQQNHHGSIQVILKSCVVKWVIKRPPVIVRVFSISCAAAAAAAAVVATAATTTIVVGGVLS
jgi:hypothetical protein